MAETKGTTSNFNYKIEVKNDVFTGVLVSDSNSNIFIGGDSLESRTIRDKRDEELRAEKQRETIARETVKGRYSPSYKNSSEAEIIGDSYEQCVIYAKRVTGINKTLGYGGRGAIEGTEPRSGAIIVERAYRHVLAAETVTETGIWSTESNFIKGHITRRFIPYSDILGFIYR